MEIISIGKVLMSVWYIYLFSCLSFFFLFFFRFFIFSSFFLFICSNYLSISLPIPAHLFTYSFIDLLWLLHEWIKVYILLHAWSMNVNSGYVGKWHGTLKLALLMCCIFKRQSCVVKTMGTPTNFVAWTSSWIPLCRASDGKMKSLWVALWSGQGNVPLGVCPIDPIGSYIIIKLVSEDHFRNIHIDFT